MFRNCVALLSGGFIITMIVLNGEAIMFRCAVVLFISSLIFSNVFCELLDACEAGCTCSLTRARNDDDASVPAGRRVVCDGDTLPLTTLNNMTFPNDTTQL